MWQETNFSHLLKEKRRLREITVREMAELAGVSPGYYSDIESGGATRRSGHSEHNLTEISSIAMPVKHVSLHVMHLSAVSHRHVGLFTQPRSTRFRIIRREPDKHRLANLDPTRTRVDLNIERELALFGRLDIPRIGTPLSGIRDRVSRIRRVGLTRTNGQTGRAAGQVQPELGVADLQP